MSDPRRLRESDPALAALLGAARAYRPSVKARRRTLAALGLPLTAAFAGSALAPAAAASWAAKTWIVATAVAVTGGGGAAVAYRVARGPAEGERARPAEVKRLPGSRPAPSAATPVIVALAVGGAAPALPLTGTMRPAAATLRPDTNSTVPARPVPVAASRLPRAAVPTSPVPLTASSPPAVVSPLPLAPAAVLIPPSAPLPRRPPPLAEELRLLGEAEAAVRARNRSRALAALDEHGRRFGAGALVEEASVLRMNALLDAGEPAAVRSLAETFLSHHPRSVLAERVRSLLALSTKGQKP